MMFHFIRPGFLLGLPLIVMVWWLWRRANDPLRGWREVMDPELLKELVVRQTEHRDWRTALKLASWSIAAIALAGPTWRPEPSPFADDAAPVMILLKADESMNSEDLAPSRMERARLKAADFARLRRGKPTGLIAYAGTAHLVLPPTRDTEVVATMALDIAPEIMPETGDDLAGAIALATQVMESGALVVMADTLPEHTTDRPLRVLGVARDPIKGTTPITADSTDLEKIDRATRSGMSAATGTDATRWAEAGWWLLPLLAFFALLPFRRSSE